MLTRKRYNKKRLSKTLCKKRYKITKKQRGGFICQTPNIIKVQKSYLKLNKSDDKMKNNIAYGNYLDECNKYSTCVFQNINNVELLLGVLKILKDIGNKETNFTYKHIIDTSDVKYENKDTVETQLSNNIITQNEKIINSKFLDIYVTYLLEQYLGFKLTDNNTVFLHKDDYDFIINEDTILAKNFIISTIINLEDKLILRSIIEILNNTFKMIVQDRALLKDYAIYLGEITNTQTSREAALFVSNMLFTAFIQIFLFNFSRFISTMVTVEESAKSYILMRVLYKFLFIKIENMLHTYKINGTDEHILPFLNDKKLDNFIIGNNTENIENLHIFKHLETTFTTVNCIIKNFLKPERLTILCNELDGYLTRNVPLNNLESITFLTEGCKVNALWHSLSFELLKEIYKYNHMLYLCKDRKLII